MIMNETINKPITMLADDFKKQMANLINTTNLPYFIIESIMKDLVQEVAFMSNKQLEIDEKRYNEALSKLQQPYAQEAEHIDELPIEQFGGE